jgi:hypothetical protein
MGISSCEWSQAPLIGTTDKTSRGHTGKNPRLPRLVRPYLGTVAAAVLEHF